MSEKPQGRKRHTVNGNVSKIEKKEEGLGLGKLNKEENFFSKLVKNISNPNNKKGK